MEHGARLSDVRALPRVTTAAQSAARDQAAIAAGVPSFDLMQRAGATAAALILRDYADGLADGVALCAGPGNNGGDAYLVAAQLARAGVTVRLHATAPPRTPDAQRAARLATPALVHGEPTGHERLVVDGILGTGHRGALRGEAAGACARVGVLRAAGARVVALDVPTGLDASTGAIADGSVPAHVTVSFGTLKRGHLLRRDHVGRLVLLDIGLDGDADRVGDHDDGAWHWPDPRSLGARVPTIAWDAHKGTRGRIAIIGGAAGMAGAVVLATQAALAAGVGLAHAIVHDMSVAALQHGVVQAITHRWPPPLAAERGDPSDAEPEQAAYDAIAIGPGLGRSRESAQLLERRLLLHPGIPLVLDADALWLAADAAAARGTDAASMLRHWTRDATHTVCTPHPGEFARLVGRALPAAWEDRAALLAEFSRRAGTTVLLKGAPTLVAHAHDALVAVPYGTPLLSTGGSGDCLTGIVVTLLAQGCSAADAAVLGAGVHGLAAERATAALGHVRGSTLDDLLAQLPATWRSLERASPPSPGVLAELPAVS